MCSYSLMQTQGERFGELKHFCEPGHLSVTLSGMYLHPFDKLRRNVDNSQKPGKIPVCRLDFPG